MNLTTARKNLNARPPEDVCNSLVFLKESGALADLPLVMSLIKHPDLTVKETALLCASNLIREKLIEHYHELEPAMRKKLGTILDSLHPTVVDEISQDIFSNDPERRIKAVQILGLLKKHPKIRNILARLIKDRDQKIRATAVNLLGKMTGANDLHVILSLLSDVDKRVRANTIEALESLSNPRVIPFLLRYRKDTNNRIRGNTLKALYNLGHKEIDESIVEMLESNDPFMMASALWVLTKVPLITRTIEDLCGHSLLHENKMVLDNAHKALTALNTPRAKGYLRYLDSEPTKVQSI
jgi:HEAT repeat protein